MTEQSKILVVDDKPENLTAMKQVLDQVGVEVVTALSGMWPEYAVNPEVKSKWLGKWSA